MTNHPNRSKRKTAIQKAREIDMRLIRAIVTRASILYADYGIQIVRLDTQMDLCAVHFDIQPLRLADMLGAADFDFMHDITGINNNLNRETLELMNGWTPRFCQREAA